MLYIDGKTTETQEEGLLEMIAHINSTFTDTQNQYKKGETLGVRRVPIELTISEDGLTRRASIAGILEVESQRSGEEQAEEVMDVWSDELTYARTTLHTYDDAEFGKSWDLSDMHSNHVDFELTKAQYDARKIGWHGWDPYELWGK